MLLTLPTLSPIEMANTVTSYTHIFVAITTVILFFLIRNQPYRWLGVYFSFVITGFVTLWYHGYGQTFPQLVADWITNLLVTHMVIVAYFLDFTTKRTALIVNFISGFSKIGVILAIILLGNPAYKILQLSLGEYGGFFITEMILVIDLIVAFTIYFRNRQKCGLLANRVMLLQFCWLLVGFYFSTAGSLILVGRVWPYHAIWHVIGALSFLILWIANHLRFNSPIILKPNATIQEKSEKKEND